MLDSSNVYLKSNTMADMNVPANDAPAKQAHAATPLTRTHDQILPSSKWVPINVLRDALDITPTNDNNPYVALPLSNTVIKYVNTLGNLSTIRNMSAISAKTSCALDSLGKNLTMASRGKKKTTHLLIPSVRFTKLIIHHLKTKYNIHPRTGSPLHYSHDENVLNTLRFVGKDGREIFGMPIPDALLTDEIKGAPYYGEYQEHVAKYQKYLDAEHGKAEEGGTTESPKAIKVTKPKAVKATKPASDKAPKLTSTQPPKPKPAPTRLSKAVPEKKEKLVKETPDEPSPTKRSNSRLVGKIHKPKSPLKLVDEPIAEDVPVEEPAYNKEEANLQWALELSLKEQAEQTQGPARPVDRPNPGNHDEGQAGPNPGVQDEGQAGSNLGDAAKSQPKSSHVVHAGPKLEHMDLEATDASTQQNPKQMDEKFTTTAYPNVQENLKMPSEDHVILEEPASSTRTLSSLQNLEKVISFTDQFFVEKQQEEEPGKTNDEAEVQSMVSVPIHQDTSSVPPMTTMVIDLTTSQYGSPLPTSTATTSATTSDTRYELAGVSGTQELSLTDSLIQDDSIPDEPTIFSSNVSNAEKNWATTLVSAYEIPAENSLLAKTGDMTNFLNWYFRHVNKTELTQEDLEGQAYEVDWTNPEGDQVRVDVNRTLPIGGPSGYEFKHDYTIIKSLRSVVFLINNNERKIMRFNKIYKFSDSMLTWILEALVNSVKEFKIKRLNPGMSMRLWTQKNVTRSKEFIAAIERLLQRTE
nr:hypothetical protein [Tanacetum cinerariifolium]